MKILNIVNFSKVCFHKQKKGKINETQNRFAESGRQRRFREARLNELDQKMLLHKSVFVGRDVSSSPADAVIYGAREWNRREPVTLSIKLRLMSQLHQFLIVPSRWEKPSTELMVSSAGKSS